jgi:hypothetical protein
MQHSQYLDPVGEDRVIDDIGEPPQTTQTLALPNYCVQLGGRFDVVQRL